MNESRHKASVPLASLVLAALLVPSAGAQLCPPLECSLLVSCTDCSVGETILFNAACTKYIKVFGCFLASGELTESEKSVCDPSCEETLLVPGEVYYQGETKDENGNWAVDADCVRAVNPLSYTFVSGDVGEYRRQACLDSNCQICTKTVAITVE